MIALLLSVLLLQAIPAQQPGRVTGVLRDSLGVPLAGVRMAAVARSASLEQIATEGTSMTGLTETDEHGRFVLEGVPPGRYSIAAGRLDLQTFYPGTQALADARILTVAAGETLAGIDFVLNDSSWGRALRSSPLLVIQANIPVQVAVEGGGKLPVSADGRGVMVRLDSASFSQTVHITRGYFLVPGPVEADFRVAVENLPAMYEVKSISYGANILPKGIFRLTFANFSEVSVVRSERFQGQPPLRPPPTLLITIGEVPRPSTGGVRVSGQAGAGGSFVYINGNPGVAYSDGTFEFRDVAPGRYLIASISASGPLAAVVVVGNQNVGGIELKGIDLLPENARDPKDPRPAGDLSPGTIAPLARLRGTVIEESTQAPITQGEILIQSGDTSRTVSIDEKGRFETFPLLPGVYDLKLRIFGHAASSSTVEVDDKDLEVQLKTRPL